MSNSNFIVPPISPETKKRLEEQLEKRSKELTEKPMKEGEKPKAFYIGSGFVRRGRISRSL